MSAARPDARPPETVLPDPVHFTARALDGLGGLVEAHDGSLTAVLPRDVSRSLALPEEVELNERGGPGVIACGIGSPLLEALVERGRAAVPVAAIRLGAAAVSDGQARSLGAAWTLRNGVTAVTASALAEATYAHVALAWTVEADERHEGLLSVTIAADHGGIPGDGFVARCRVEDNEATPAVAPPFDPARLSAWITRLTTLRIPRPVAPVIAVAARRQHRDHERIAGYYGTMITEAKRPKRRVDAAAIEAKVRHLIAERDSRLADLAHRYTARVRVRVAGVLFIRTQVRTVTLRARRRRGERDLVLHLPPGTRSFDQLPCDGCEGWLAQPLLCDDKLHVLCTRCAPESTGRPRCPACGAVG